MFSSSKLFSTQDNELVGGMGNVSVTEEETKEGSEETAGEAEDGEQEDCVDEEYLHSPEWIQKEKHVFILSESGKPIYTRYVCVCVLFI